MNQDPMTAGDWAAAYAASDAQYEALYDRIAGCAWGTEVIADDLMGYDPVISPTGRIVDLMPPMLRQFPEAAAKRSCFWDDTRHAFVRDWAVGGILRVYLSHDASDWDVALAQARKWLALWFSDSEAYHWLSVGVADPDQAVALQAAGLTPEDLPPWTRGWRSPAQIQELLDHATR